MKGYSDKETMDGASKNGLWRICHKEANKSNPEIMLE